MNSKIFFEMKILRFNAGFPNMEFNSVKRLQVVQTWEECEEYI